MGPPFLISAIAGLVANAVASILPAENEMTFNTPTFHVQYTTTLAADKRVSESFMSFSIELADFVDYVGTPTTPNNFTAQVLSYIELASGGHAPYIRVGGASQDTALYDANQKEPIKGNPPVLGPSFFDSYKVIPATRYSHGFNMLKATDDHGWQTLLDTVPLACKALSPYPNGSPRFYMWEFGNKANYWYLKNDRPQGWSASNYTDEWLRGTRKIRELVQQHCSNLTASANSTTGFIAPSLVMTDAPINASDAWTSGMGKEKSVALFGKQYYTLDSIPDGMTLQKAVMNHILVTYTLDQQIIEYNQTVTKAQSLNIALPPRLILSEYNTVSSQGTQGVTDVFGAALWGVDFAMYAASVGFSRIHAHQGVDKSQNSWQPKDTQTLKQGVRPAFYGNLAVATAIGNSNLQYVMVKHLEGEGLSTDVDSAYGIYESGRLARIMVINMRSFSSSSSSGDFCETRPSKNYTFTFQGTAMQKSGDDKSTGQAILQRLMATGSDAKYGISWDGWNYDTVTTGRPLYFSNVTTSEVTSLTNNTCTINVPDSSAVLLHL